MRLNKIKLKHKFDYAVRKYFTSKNINTNPFEINNILTGAKINVFLKNISPAYFSNLNISRIQIAKSSNFDTLRKRGAICIPVGYDLQNDTFVIWNPYIFLERINVKDNISIYSRFSIQKEAREMDFIDFNLSNNEKVYAVNPQHLGQFISEYGNYFENNKSIQEVNLEKELNKSLIHSAFNDKQIVDINLLLSQNKWIPASQLYAKYAISKGFKNYILISKHFDEFKKVFNK